MATSPSQLLESFGRQAAVPKCHNAPLGDEERLENRPALRLLRAIRRHALGGDGLLLVLLPIQGYGQGPTTGVSSRSLSYLDLRQPCLIVSHDPWSDTFWVTRNLNQLVAEPFQNEQQATKAKFAEPFQRPSSISLRGAQLAQTRYPRRSTREVRSRWTLGKWCFRLFQVPKPSSMPFCQMRSSAGIVEKPTLAMQFNLKGQHKPQSRRRSMSVCPDCLTVE